MSMNLIEGIQAECNRLRDELLPEYARLGTIGAFGKAMLGEAVKEGEAAIASGDVVRMCAALKRLQGCE